MPPSWLNQDPAAWQAFAESMGNAGALPAPNPFEGFGEAVQAVNDAGGLSIQNFYRTPEGQASLAQQAEESRVNAQDARYGTDLSWLDPSFQYQASLLGQSAGSQAFADPNAIAQQNAAMTRANELANTNLQFESPAQQQALMQQWAQIQGGAGAPQFMGNSAQQGLMQQLMGIQAPQFESGAQQQAALDRLNAVGPAQFSGDADQRAVLNQALGMATNTGPGSLAFDTSGRQGEQYGNLQGIIAGGGATAIEMADRARQRGDSEAWLRGQREADMADYAERGLTGSGMELQALAADRQSAAGRNSLADLETAKALEERRLGAINSAAGLATNMRGQTIDEQGLLNNRATSGLSAASSVANSMRGANIQEQTFLNESARAQAAQAAGIASTMRGQTATEQLGLNQALQNQATSAAGIAGQMRSQDYNERTFLDDRMTNALGQQVGLANTMRNQTADEQVANRAAQQAALGTLASTSGQARGQSAQEAQYRATSADDFAQLNQAAVNSASRDNTGFLQDAYQQMMNNRQQWEMAGIGRDVGIAQGLEAGDRADNNTGFAQGTGVAGIDTATWNSLSSEQRSQILAIFQGGQAGTAAAQAAGGVAAGQIAAGGTAAAGTAIGAIIGGAGAGSAAGGMTAGQGAATGAQVGSQALTQAQPTLGPSPTTPAEQEAARRRATTTYRTF